MFSLDEVKLEGTLQPHRVRVYYRVRVVHKEKVSQEGGRVVVKTESEGRSQFLLNKRTFSKL